jgi:hypothetical protein
MVSPSVPGGELFIHDLDKETPMRRTLFSIAAASVLAAGVGLAHGQTMTTTTTETWSTDEGPALRSYSTTEHWRSYDDPAFHASIGEEVPNSVVLHPLPDTMRVPDAERYSYSIINNNPVVVERTTRRVVHSWE